MIIFSYFLNNFGRILTEATLLIPICEGQGACIQLGVEIKERRLDEQLSL